MVERHPDLELVAASRLAPLGGVAPLTQVGGDHLRAPQRAEPDVVLNAVVGFAGVRATLWALERGIDLALANKESLVAAVTSRLRPLGGTGGSPPVDSEHSALSSAWRAARRKRSTPSCSCLGRPFRGRNRSNWRT